MNSRRIALAGILLVLMLVAAGEPRAASAVDSATEPGAIALTALKYEGSHGGQCWEFVKNVVREATGKEIGFDYREGFFEAGAVEVTDLSEVRSGDIIQVADDDWTSPDADYPGLHTSIVLSNLGDGRFDVIDSNQNWDEMVWLRPGYDPFDAAARYGLDVHIYRIGADSTAPASDGGSAGPTGDRWHAGERGAVHTPGDCLNLRTGGGLGNSVLACLPDGTRVTGLAESVVVGPRQWVKVRTDIGAEGWVATEYLTKDATPSTGSAAAPPSLQFRTYVPGIAVN